MHLRLLTRADEPFLWIALYHALYVPPGEHALPAEIVQVPELAQYVQGWMQRPGDFGVAAEQAGRPVGAVWLRCWRAAERGYGFVDEATPELSMAVLPEYRGRGIGTALLERLLCSAADVYQAVSLSVAKRNPARRLYERAGFRCVSKSAGDSLIMVLRYGPGGVLP